MHACTLVNCMQIGTYNMLHARFCFMQSLACNLCMQNICHACTYMKHASCRHTSCRHASCRHLGYLQACTLCMQNSFFSFCMHVPKTRAGNCRVRAGNFRSWIFKMQFQADSWYVDTLHAKSKMKNVACKSRNVACKVEMLHGHFVLCCRDFQAIRPCLLTCPGVLNRYSG